MKQVNDRSHVRPISVADRFRTDLHHRSTLINELYFLHQRTASLMSSIATRETHRPLRDLLQDQTVVDQYIAGRLRSVASEHGMPPGPSANLSSTAVLEEVRHTDRDRSIAHQRPIALRNALRSLRLHAIRSWSELLDALDDDHQSGLRKEILTLQTLEADQYRALSKFGHSDQSGAPW